MVVLSKLFCMADATVFTRNVLQNYNQQQIRARHNLESLQNNFQITFPHGVCHCIPFELDPSAAILSWFQQFFLEKYGVIPIEIELCWIHSTASQVHAR